jgi:prepilin-type N-terminal cleavage/methylation domain-containing protein
MTSAAKTNKVRRSGFTLIEIVLVLAIAAVVMGGAVGLFIYSSDERGLKRASGEIEMMAKKARVIAILHQTPYALEFREGVVRLLPLAQAGKDLQKSSRMSKEPEAPPGTNAGDNRQFTLPEGVVLSIRRWNSDQWLGTTKNATHVWRFDPDGLCEPISVRLALGHSWSEDTYQPLTASIAESQFESR